MKEQTYEEFQAETRRALSGVNTLKDWYSRQPAHISRWGKPTHDRVAEAILHATAVEKGTAMTHPVGSYKLMQARYDGRCVDCGGYIQAGDTMRYDGKVHHADPSWCERVLSEAEEAASDLAAEQANERWFEERGHGPSMDEQIEEDRERWLESLDRVDFSAIPSAMSEILSDDGDEDLVSAPKPAPYVRDGTYTIVRPDGGYRTLKVRTQAEDSNFAPGKQVIKYLAKSDNEDEDSYVGFAFLNDMRVAMWKRFAGNQELREDAETLLADPETAGEHYALESGRCFRCGHKLTVPASIYRGMGPDCAANY